MNWSRWPPRRMISSEMSARSAKRATSFKRSWSERESLASATFWLTRARNRSGERRARRDVGWVERGGGGGGGAGLRGRCVCGGGAAVGEWGGGGGGGDGRFGEAGGGGDEGGAVGGAGGGRGERADLSRPVARPRQ